MTLEWQESGAQRGYVFVIIMEHLCAVLSVRVVTRLRYQSQRDVDCPHAFHLTAMQIVLPPASEGLPVL